MIPTLLAAGVIALQTSAGTGGIDVPPERIATAANVQGISSSGVGIPYGAAEWEQPFDPGDQRPFGFSFDDVLDEGDTISSISRIAMSPQAAALGVAVDETSGRTPIIETPGKRVLQVWFTVGTGFQESGSFDANGVKLPVSFRVITVKNHRVERTGVLTVRQL